MSNRTARRMVRGLQSWPHWLGTESAAPSVGSKVKVLLGPDSCLMSLGFADYRLRLLKLEALNFSCKPLESGYHHVALVTGQ